MSTLAINYNGLTIDGTQNNFLIDYIDGIDAVEHRTSQENRTAGDGGFVYAQKDSMRVITIEGTVRGSTIADFFSNKSLLVNAFSSGQARLLTLTTWDGNVSYIMAWVLNPPLIQHSTAQGTNRAKFQVQFICPTPYFSDTDVSGIGDLQATINLAQEGGFDMLVDMPFDMSGGGINYATINNAGDVNIFPYFEITAGATLTSPRVTNSTTGDSFYINRTLNSGDVVTVQVKQDGIYVLLNGSINYYRYYAGETIYLEPGNNTIRFTASSYDANSTLKVYTNNLFRSA